MDSATIDSGPADSGTARSARTSMPGAETFLARTPLFRDAGHDARVRVARHARRIRARRGDVIYHCGDAANGLYVIAVGHVALTLHASPGREKVVELRGPSESFGEDGMVLDVPHGLTARMLTDGTLIYVPHRAALAEIDANPRLAQGILRNLSRRSCELMRHIGSSATQSGIERVASFLMRSLVPEDDGPQDVQLPVPKLVIASLLDLTKETLSRALRELSDRKLIDIRGRTIHVPDPVALAAVCKRGRSCDRCWGCQRGGAWIA